MCFCLVALSFPPFSGFPLSYCWEFCPAHLQTTMIAVMKGCHSTVSLFYLFFLQFLFFKPWNKQIKKKWIVKVRTLRKRESEAEGKKRNYFYFLFFLYCLGIVSSDGLKTFSQVLRHSHHIFSSLLSPIIQAYTCYLL